MKKELKRKTLMNKYNVQQHKQKTKKKNKNKNKNKQTNKQGRLTLFATLRPAQMHSKY